MSALACGRPSLESVEVTTENVAVLGVGMGGTLLFFPYNLLSIRTPFFYNEEQVVPILCPMGSGDSAPVPETSPSPV